jgi:hypothetical protein
VKGRDALLPSLFNFALEYVIGRIQGNQEELKPNCTQQLLVSVDDFNLLSYNLSTVERSTKALLGTSKEYGLEVHAEKIKYMFTRMQDNHILKDT